jgi:4-amino-4-deoxy-L-arabinose transferase-like glycosyltransferase
MPEKTNKTAISFFTKAPSLVIFIVSFVVLMACQYKEGIIDYITRFPVFAQNMLRDGVTFFPIIHGHPFTDYTVTNTLLIYLSSLFFGKVSILSMGFPYCVAASLTLVLIYKLGALHNKKWGLYAVLFAFLAWKFADAIHFLALDVYPMLAVTFCFYIAYSAKLQNSRLRLWWLPLGLIFGFMMRGPVGFIVPAAVVFCFYLINKDWKTVLIFSVGSLVLFGFCLALFLWAAYLQGGSKFLSAVIMSEAIQKVHGAHAGRYYYYFLNGLFCNYFLTVIFALVVIIKKRKQIFRAQTSEANKFLLYLSVWFLLIIIGYTIPGTKKARYILPIVPAISLLAAYMFVDVGETFAKVRRVLLRICFLLPLIGLLLVFSALLYNFFATVTLQAHFVSLTVVCLLLFIVGDILTRRFSSHQAYPALIIIVGIATLLLINMLLVYPIGFHLGLPQEPEPVFLSYWPW